MKQSQQYFLRTWHEQHRAQFEQEILNLEAPTTTVCACGEAARWRCKDCFGAAETCGPCMQKSHEHLPWHRVDSWHINHCFNPAWLYQVGVAIHTGHGGAPCPAATRNVPSTFSAGQESSQKTSETARRGAAPATTTPAPQLEGDEDSWEDIEDDQSEEARVMAELNDILDQHPPRTYGGDGTLTVVDISGIHSFPVHYCRCAGAQPPHLQLLKLRLYPTSYLRPRTVFTFGVLDDFLQHNVVCKTSAHNYYTLLRRKTNSTFPDMVPVCTAFCSN